MYLKLIEDYKAYDAEQKMVIRRLQTDLDFLKFENPEYIKLLRRNEEFINLQRKVRALSRENERLINKLATILRNKES